MSKFEEVSTTEIWHHGDEVVDPTLDIPNNSGAWGFQHKGYGRPEQLAPSQDDVGGFIFLPADIEPELLGNLVALTELGKSTRYGMQVLDAPAGMEAQLGYMRKVIIADRFALRFLFKTLDQAAYDTYPEQPLSTVEAVQAFAAEERSKYGTMFGTSGLAGKFGGDGHYAQEALGFGFAVENNYYGVISIWSRGWLCTK